MEARSLIFLELHNTFMRCSTPHHLTPIVCSNLFFLSTNMQDLLGLDITTRKREVKHIVELNGIKHINLPAYFADIGGPSFKYKEIPFSQLFPYVYCVFMTRNLFFIESNDKKIPLVLAVGVLQGDYLVQIF